jgi:hypothetical protein
MGDRPWDELIERLQADAGVDFGDGRLWPNAPLADPQARRALVAVLETALAELRAVACRDAPRTAARFGPESFAATSRFARIYDDSRSSGDVDRFNACGFAFQASGRRHIDRPPGSAPLALFAWVAGVPTGLERSAGFHARREPAWRIVFTTRGGARTAACRPLRQWPTNVPALLLMP